MKYDFKFIKSTEPTLEDDMYELAQNPNFYIQCSEDKFIVHVSGIGLDRCPCVNDHGIFNSLQRAKNALIKIYKKGDR